MRDGKELEQHRTFRSIYYRNSILWKTEELNLFPEINIKVPSGKSDLLEINGDRAVAFLLE